MAPNSNNFFPYSLLRIICLYVLENHAAHMGIVKGSKMSYPVSKVSLDLRDVFVGHTTMDLLLSLIVVHVLSDATFVTRLMVAFGHRAIRCRLTRLYCFILHILLETTK